MAEDLRTERKGRILAVRDLPTLPKVLEEVSKLVERPDSTTEQVAKLISMDQVLSAKVLKMVNSPVYGFPGRISSIGHALVLLGFNVLRSIIVSTSVFEVMTENMVGLWEHSLGCAMACGSVARMLKLKDAEEYAVAGLLHDLGKVVATVQLPDLKSEIEQTVAARDISYLDAERAVMGFGHDRQLVGLGWCGRDFGEKFPRTGHGQHFAGGGSIVTQHFDGCGPAGQTAQFLRPAGGAGIVIAVGIAGIEDGQGRIGGKSRCCGRCRQGQDQKQTAQYYHGIIY